MQLYIVCLCDCLTKEMTKLENIYGSVHMNRATVLSVGAVCYLFVCSVVFAAFTQELQDRFSVLVFLTKAETVCSTHVHTLTCLHSYVCT